jgi:Flp pilus assembly protein TadB
MEVIIAIVVLILLARLGRWAIEEGIRKERQKKFMRDMENFDKKNKKK